MPPAPLQRETVLNAVAVALSTVSKRLNGVSAELSEADRVIGGIPGFDSLCALEATVLIEVNLGFTMPENVFINEQGTRALSVHEAVNRILLATGVSHD